MQSYNLQFKMIYLSIVEFSKAVSENELFQHEIKGKRLRKELKSLEEYQNSSLTFKKYQITRHGVSFYVSLKLSQIETHYKNKIYDFELFANLEYPFDRPHLYYIHESSPFGYCLNLLDTTLASNWGPSLLFTSIFDKIPQVAQAIAEDNEKLKADYLQNDFYYESILKRYKVQLFEVNEYKWKYLIKSASKKIIGLTKDYLLKFVVDEDRLKLELRVKIKQIKEANAVLSKKDFQLDITYLDEETKVKLVLGGKQADIENILYFLNPIETIERRLVKLQKNQFSNSDPQEIIKTCTELVEYYSLKDQVKMKKYIETIHKMVKKSYENSEDHSEKGKQMELKEDIKT